MFILANRLHCIDLVDIAGLKQEILNEQSSMIWLLFFCFLTILVCWMLISRHYRQKIAGLERKIKEKNDALTNSMLQLESSRTELKNSIAFRERAISIVVHDLKSPLSFLYRIVNHLHETHDTIAKSQLQKLTGEMSYTTYEIVGFVNDLLDWLNSNQIDFSLRPTMKPFNDFINTKCAIYAEMASRKGLAFNVKSSPDFIISADYNLLQIVIRNLLDNAIKNTEEGSITIDGYSDDASQYIIIADTGIGINKDKAIELEYGVITKKTNESSQIGFRIVYDMVAKMNGKIKIDSVAGKGVTVKIILPK
jgi:signal transduction histidine kinase